MALRREYSGKFVAILNEETVVASGETYSEAFKKATEMGLGVDGGLSIRFIRPAKDHMD